MNFQQLINQRFSVRKYTGQSIPKKVLENIAEAGRMAPSAVNYQPWHFIIVENKEARAALYSCYPREWFGKAPVYIVVCSDSSQGWVRTHDQKNFAEIDACIAADHMVLQATESGLGSCWVCNFNPDSCKKALNLPANIEPLVIVPLGFPNETAREKIRKPLNGILHWDSF